MSDVPVNSPTADCAFSNAQVTRRPNVRRPTPLGDGRSDTTRQLRDAWPSASVGQLDARVGGPARLCPTDEPPMSVSGSQVLDAARLSAAARLATRGSFAISRSGREQQTRTSIRDSVAGRALGIPLAQRPAFSAIRRRSALREEDAMPDPVSDAAIMAALGRQMTRAVQQAGRGRRQPRESRHARLPHAGSASSPTRSTTSSVAGGADARPTPGTSAPAPQATERGRGRRGDRASPRVATATTCSSIASCWR